MQPAEVSLIEVDRAIERSRRPCLREFAVINPAEGCLADCLFCGLASRARPPARLRVKSNLEKLLAEELACKSSNRPPPRAFFFDTATDSFQPVDELLQVVFESMRLVLEAGFPLYFVTRGDVPEEFADLFRRHAQQVHAQVSFFTMDETLAALYEPRAAEPRQRLECVRRLVQWQVDVKARLEPIIPLLADTAAHFEELLRYLRSAGVEEVVANYLVLRPHLLELFEQFLPQTHFQLIKGSFKGQSWHKVGLHRMTKLLPNRIRSKGYERLRRVAARAGMAVTVCSCDNPQSGATCFPLQRPVGRADVRGQLDLFAVQDN